VRRGVVAKLIAVCKIGLSIGLGIAADRAGSVLTVLGCALRKFPGDLKLALSVEFEGYSLAQDHSLTIYALKDLGLAIIGISLFGLIAVVVDFAIERVEKTGRLQRIVMVASILAAGAIFGCIEK
jgi:hypothetical protein